MDISNGIIALATAVIAYYAWQTKKSQDKFQGQLSDLYKGVIIATLLSSNTDSNQINQFIAKFKEHYDGETPIFKDGLR